LFADDKAWVLDKLGREKDALFAWNRALDEYPQNDEYLAQRGVLIIRTGGLEAGVDDIRTAYRLDPFAHNMTWAVKAATSALVYAGYQRTQSGDDTGAVAAYDLALSLSPGNTEALEWKVRAGAHLVGTDTVTKLEAACRDNPTDFDSFKKLDDALVRTHEYGRIVTHWTTYLEKRPDDARAYLERGGAYTFLRDAEHATADLDRACAGGLQSGCEGARFVRARAAASAAPHP
jgi:tetratricopeptide (TPR) repeat protein